MTRRHVLGTATAAAAILVPGAVAKSKPLATASFNGRLKWHGGQTNRGTLDGTWEIRWSSWIPAPTNTRVVGRWTADNKLTAVGTSVVKYAYASTPGWHGWYHLGDEFDIGGYQHEGLSPEQCFLTAELSSPEDFLVAQENALQRLVKVIDGNAETRPY